MNTELLRLIGLLRIYNGGEISKFLDDELTTFAKNYDITTIKDLVNAMEEEMTYWEDK